MAPRLRLRTGSGEASATSCLGRTKGGPIQQYYVVEGGDDEVNRLVKGANLGKQLLKR